MAFLLLIFGFLLLPFQMVLFDFTKSADLDNWYIVDDGVMGGLSKGNFSVNDDGHAVFTGYVSLENYGGFSSVRYTFPTQDVQAYNYLVLRVKGDQKKYQLRVKSDRYQRYNYAAEFKTSGDWETIEIKLSDMYPQFRGRKLDIPDYPGQEMGELAILIGNKKAESFSLLIDKIELR